ncbi:polyribonucleotide nucleotidyltransferase [Pseudomonadota bacterium]
MIKKEIEWGGKKLSIETGRVARQSNSVIARMDDTIVLCTATVAPKGMTGVDFVPLTVNFLEKGYAVGKIPGGYGKREAKPTDEATLVARLIDRPIRPLLPSNFRNETQVICTLLSLDTEANYDVVAMIGASAALSISNAPFEGPLASAKVGYIDDKYVLNPGKKQLKESKLDLTVAGTSDSVLMVESEASELSEEVMLGAVEFGHKEFQPVIELIKDFTSNVSVEKIVPSEEDFSELEKNITELASSKITEAYSIREKGDRRKKLEVIKDEVVEKFGNEEDIILTNKIAEIFKNIEKEVVRGDLLNKNIRIDGRKTDEIRPIKAEIDVLPKVHGSALFTRGETQALVVATLGGEKDEQYVDGVDGETYKGKFMLHYNFPPYSVGEISFLRAPGRREIGHGKLAYRAVSAMMPNEVEFPYTVRIVSEITESNGSSSMATVCGTSLALMATGVPFKKPVSGIAMGLVKEGDKFVVLSDIMGDEDHLGDMDFKVAGTKDGVTALQMDIKCKGVTHDIMKIALDQANRGRLHILEKMSEAITEARSELNENAPKMTVIKIPVAKIKDVIGSKGKVIKEIIEKTGTSIDIDDDGNVKILGDSQEKIEETVNIINGITMEPEVGQIYEGKVVKVIDSGAFVNLFGDRDGFVHISELADYRVDFVDDILTEGDVVKVKVIGFDRKFRPKLSYKEVDQKIGMWHKKNFKNYMIRECYKRQYIFDEHGLPKSLYDYNSNKKDVVI